MAQTSSLPAPVEDQPNDAPLVEGQSNAVPEAEAVTTATTQPSQAMDLPAGIQTESSRDTLIASGALLLLAVVFFVIKNTYANWRVKERVSPSRANASGWFLFLGLMSVAVIGTLAVLNSSRFMAPMYWGPLAVLAAISMVAWLTTYSAKN